MYGQNDFDAAVDAFLVADANGEQDTPVAGAEAAVEGGMEGIADGEGGEEWGGEEEEPATAAGATEARRAAVRPAHGAARVCAGC